MTRWLPAWARSVAGLALAAALLVVCPPPADAADTDTIVLKNGDRLMGEVKKLDLGKLEVSTGAMSTVYIKWDRVAELTAPERFEIETSDGTRFYGSLAPAAPGKLGMVLDQHTEEVPFEQVVRISPIHHTFWRRLDGSVNVGATYARSSGVGQGTFNANVITRRPRFEGSSSLSLTLTQQQEEPDTTRAVLTLGYSRLLQNRWFIPGAGRFEHNSDLGVDLRSSVGIGVGRFLVQTNRSRFGAMGGIVVNREVPVSGESTSNLEAAFGADYSFFTYDTPKTDITLGLAVFPSLTVAGRVRAQFDVNVEREIVKDFAVGASAYDTFDSQPPGGSTKENDFGFTLSIGWKF